MGSSKVSWFKRFRKPKYTATQLDIPMTTILRWYLYDTDLYNPNDISELLGLSRVSEEGNTKEKQDSDMRVSDVLSIFPYLESIADISANVLTTIHLKEMHDASSPALEEFSEEIESMATVYKAVALSTLIGAFSIGVNLDLLHLTGVTSELDIEMEEFDE